MTNLPQPGSMDLDVTYLKVDGLDVKLDLYYPKSPGPWPCIIFIHGGGWTEGDKAPVPFDPAATNCLVASLNYRMFPSYRFPAMIEDVKCAIRFLRAHAAAYNLDPQRIALIGHSAGGHLAALAGLVDETAGWDVGAYLEQSSRVQAVVEVSGPTDLSSPLPAWVMDLTSKIFDPDKIANASPTTHARPDAPPFLIVHGDADASVPVEQAHLLYNALSSAGACVEKIILHNTGHGLEPVGGIMTPSIEEALTMIFHFLGRSLA